MNLWAAATRRITSAYDEYDKVFVLFNGSKDSTAVLQLAREVLRSRGEHPYVVWRDPELVDKYTAKFVEDELRQIPNHRICFATPFEATMAIRGMRTSYVQWDPCRPTWGSPRLETLDIPVVVNEKRFLAHVAGMYRGKVLFLSGTRAADNIGHQRSAKHWIVSVEGSVKAWVGRPIIEWSAEDVDEYLTEIKSPVNPVYAKFAEHGTRGTVSSPLGHRWMRSARALALIDPDLVEFILRQWPKLNPDILFKPTSNKAYVEMFSQNPQDLRRWVIENIPAEEHRRALAALGKAMTLHYRNPKLYPLSYILRYFMRGAWKQKIRPIERKFKRAGEEKADGSSEG